MIGISKVVRLPPEGRSRLQHARAIDALLIASRAKLVPGVQKIPRRALPCSESAGGRHAKTTGGETTRSVER
jgi:hypothetical protein